MLTKLKITNFQRHEELSIEFDKVTTIIGSNGAGKSSTLKAIAGLLTPSAGEIEFADEQTLDAAIRNRK